MILDRFERRPIRGAAAAIVAALIASISTAEGQHSPARPDSAPAQIHRTLRAFYFNLAHHNWEALTADILAAKVVAHRPAPEALVLAAGAPRGQPGPCPSIAMASLDQATIVLEGDWAEVSVPRCTAASAGLDEFRLINFEERWRIVFIELFREPMNVSAER
jgi:hypothetical protein